MGIGLGYRPSQVLLLVQDHLDADFLHAGLERGERNLAVALPRMAVARINERPGLPYRKVQRRAFRQLVQIDVAPVGARRDRAGHAGAQGREISIRRRQAKGALEWLEGNGDVGHELALHSTEVEVHVFDLSLRVILREEASTERTWVVEHGAPLVRPDSLEPDLQHVARLGLVHGTRSDDGMWTPAGVAHPQLRQRVDWHAGLHLVEEVRPS